MRKKLLTILISIFLSSACVWAFEYDLSFQTTVLPETNATAFTFTAQSDFLFMSDSFFRFGPILNAGWSCCHNTTNGSNAMIYGYTFGGGLKTQFRLVENIYFDVDGIITACYGTFPQILWGDVTTGITYYFNKKFFIRSKAGFLFWDNLFRFSGSGSCGIRF